MRQPLRRRSRPRRLGTIAVPATTAHAAKATGTAVRDVTTGPVTTGPAIAKMQRARMHRGSRRLEPRLLARPTPPDPTDPLETTDRSGAIARPAPIVRRAATPSATARLTIARRVEHRPPT